MLEPVTLDVGGRHRTDLLGWFRQFSDLGWQVDIVHPRQVVAGALADYRHLVIPVDPLYDLDERLGREGSGREDGTITQNAAVEAAVRRFAEDGGMVFHGPGCVLAQRTFGLTEADVPFDCIAWEEAIIPHGWRTVAYDGATPMATYLKSGRTAIGRTEVVSGSVVSFGFEYGFAYATSTMPIVPPVYGKAEMHPVVLLARTPVEAVVGTSPQSPIQPRRGLEVATFGDQVVLVNHRSSPVPLAELAEHPQVHLVPSAPGWLAAHSAVMVDLGSVRS